MRPFIAFAIIAATCLGGCRTEQSLTPAAAAPAPIAALPASETRELSPAEKKILADGFSKGLKDPASAQFRWARVPKNLTPNDMIDYCGMVNAKNSYGGYVGYMPFMGSIMVGKGKIAGGIFGVSETAESQKYDIVLKMCRDKGLDPNSAL